MRIFKGFEINHMCRGNENIWLWLDVKIGSYWYVFMWVKNTKPYLYRSKDATPPKEKNEGRWFFGKNSHGNW